MKYLLRLSYDGRKFLGYQLQQNGRTVQGELMNGCRKVFGSVENFSGCSRTDSGVHALRYYVSFSADRCLPCDTVVRALNANLPFDISVSACRTVEDSFHARYSVIKKEYIYKIDTSPVRDPFSEGLVYRYRGKLDIPFLNSEAEKLIGKHDFISFQASGSSVKDTERTVYSASFDNNGTFRISADGFLYNMVRIAVGTLLNAGEGKIKDISEIIEKKDRRAAGFTAPAEGLYLNEVFYPDGINDF